MPSTTITSDFLRVNGVTVHFLRAGGGPHTILLQHGHSHCAGVWTPLIEALAADGWTVVAPDMRGHGLSDKPEIGYDFGTLSDDLVGLVEALDLKNIVYAGHSRGGSVTMLGAAATRERTRGVLVYEPTIAFEPGVDGRPASIADPVRTAASVARTRRRREVFSDLRELAARYRGQEAFRGWRDDYFEAYLTHALEQREDGSVALRMPVRVVTRLSETMLEFKPWDNLRCEALPLLALFGDRSGRLDGERDPIAALRTIFPDCTTHVFAGATHSGPMEQPEEFERLLREFATKTRCGG